MKRPHPILCCCCRRKRKLRKEETADIFFPRCLRLSAKSIRKSKGDGKRTTIIPRAPIPTQKHTWDAVRLQKERSSVTNTECITGHTWGPKNRHIFKTIPASCSITWPPPPVKRKTEVSHAALYPQHRSARLAITSSLSELPMPLGLLFLT